MTLVSFPSVEAMGEMDREKNRRRGGRNDGDNSNNRELRSISNPAGKELMRGFSSPSFEFFCGWGWGRETLEGQIVHPSR